MIVGFVGSGAGLTSNQKFALKRFLTESQVSLFLHSDGRGSDVDAHAIATELQIPIRLHPPSNPTLRAWCDAPSHTPEPFFYRYQDIVKAAAVVVTAPRDWTQQTGETWYTVRYALTKKRTCYVLDPARDELVVPRWTTDKKRPGELDG